MIKRALIVLGILIILALSAIPAYAVASVETVNPTSITDTSATLNGVITSMGGESGVYYYFEWGTSVSYGNVTPSVLLTAAATFSYHLTGLIKSRTYHYRISYRVGSDGYVAVSSTSDLSFLAESSVPEGVNNSWDLIPSNPTDPGFYNEMNMTFLGASWLVAFANVSTIPIDLIVMVLAYGLALVLGLIAYRVTMGKTNKYQQAGAMGLRPGSLFVQAMVSGLVLTYFSFAGGGVIPSWTILPFAIEAVTAIIIRQNNGQVVGG